jgi:RNA polymerase sigma-54 factor
LTVLALEATQRFEQRASPELVAYSELLALPALELEQVIEQKLAANPALERIDRDVCPFCAEPLAGDHCLVCARPQRPASAYLDAPARAEPSAAEALLSELTVLAARTDVPILEHLVDSLDERGFLDRDVSQVAAELGVAEDRIEAMLALLRSYGPPGIGARNLRECLLLQLQAFDGVELASAIVTSHLEELAAGRLGTIAVALGVTRAEVEAAAELIRTQLRPSAAPEPAECASREPPLRPDVIIRERDDLPGAYSVELVEPRSFDVVIAPSYAIVDDKMLLAHERERLRSQLAEARLFIRRLHRRWHTLRKISEVVVERQREFLRRGPRFTVPLTRSEVAAAVGVHESTVSRATAGRHVLLPSKRLVPFSCFFDAAQAPCAALAQLVMDESAPRSDRDLAQELSRLGFSVARRTVAKYRDRLGIPAQAKR